MRLGKVSTELDLVELTDCDAEIESFLDQLSAKSPSILAYHYPFYRDMLAGLGIGTPYYLGARSHGRLVGMLPAFYKGSDAGVVYSSMPFFGPNAGVICRQDEMEAPVHQALIQTFIQRAETAGALTCSIYTPFLFDRFELYDASLSGAVQVPKFTQSCRLDEVDLGHGNIGNMIRKAQKEKVEVKTGVEPSLLRGFYGIYQQNCFDYNIPLKPFECIERLLSALGGERWASIYYAFRKGQMIGGLVVLNSPMTASYYIPCTLASARQYQSGTLLIQEAMQDLRRKGVQYWNWESSPSREDGVYRFKRQWGVYESPFRVYIKRFVKESSLFGMGVDKMQACFPFFYVYPFSSIVSS